MATDFSSLDKLVEFGLGMGIATQMMNTMNNVISQTAMPGVGINPGLHSASPANASCIQQQQPQQPAVKLFYIVKDEHVAGPFDEKELATLVSNRKVNKKTFCWTPGMKSWTFAENIPEINKVLLLNS